MIKKAYKLKFNNGADFWRVYDGDTGVALSEHRSANAAKKKVRRMNKRLSEGLTIQDFRKAKEALERATANIPIYSQPHYFEFGDCKPAPTPVDPVYPTACKPWGFQHNEEKGNNPMRYETTTANAVITAAKSDEAIQREYLSERLRGMTSSWSNPKYRELRELFNIDVDNTPKTAKQLLDAIQGGKFKVDEKKLKKAEAYFNGDDDFDDDCACEYPRGVWYGITFDGPQPDHKGYDKALNDYEKAVQDTRDIIMISPPADGLAALKALENWQPTGKAN